MSGFKTNNDESIIIVHYINVDGLSPQQCSELEDRVVKTFAEEQNPKIMQIFVGVQNQPTKVEVIYPQLVESEEMKAAIEKLLSEIKNKPQQK